MKQFLAPKCLWKASIILPDIFAGICEGSIFGALEVRFCPTTGWIAYLLFVDQAQGSCICLHNFWPQVDSGNVQNLIGLSIQWIYKI
jgi:hypothetical protein